MISRAKNMICFGVYGRTALRLPRQCRGKAVLPHDLIHYVVESVMRFRYVINPSIAASGEDR